MESGYYPLEAENDSNAPYNEIENAPVDIDIETYQTLYKKVTTSTSEYIIDVDGDVSEYTASPKEIYNEKNYNLIELINKTKILFERILKNRFIVKDIKNTESTVTLTGAMVREMKDLVFHLSDWTEDITEYDFC